MSDERQASMPRELLFVKCDKGFLLRATEAGDYGRIPPQTWAFDDVSALANFLIANYGRLAQSRGSEE